MHLIVVCFNIFFACVRLKWSTKYDYTKVVVVDVQCLKTYKNVNDYHTAGVYLSDKYSKLEREKKSLVGQLNEK